MHPSSIAYLLLFVPLVSVMADEEAEICKDRDKNCFLWKKLETLKCENKVGQEYCRETCQLCKPPPEEICYFSSGEVSTYGCCWDGLSPAHGPNSEGCPVCEDYKAKSFCQNFEDSCFDTTNVQYLRDRCAETCGYCKKALSPCYDESGEETVCEGECYDIAAESLCKKREKAGFCANEDWKDYLQTNCAKTCAFCGPRPNPPTPAPTQPSSCNDKYGQRLCGRHQGKGRCTEKGWTEFMAENCAETCGYCDFP